MNRLAVYALIIAVSGTLVFWGVSRMALAVGWGCGIGMGLLHFYSLRYGIERIQKQTAAGKTAATGTISRLFFIRYVVLAGAFFLILSFGPDELGSAVGGFLAFYVVLLFDHLFGRRRSP